MRLELDGVRLPERMERIWRELEKTESLFVTGLDSSLRRRLYEMQEEGLIDIEAGVVVKKRAKRVKYNKKHRRLTVFVIGMLVGSEAILAGLYAAMV